ncbi:hypothetical protein Tco_0503361 [Tanacetum coccineum]
MSCAGIVAFARVIEIWLLKTCLRLHGYAYPVFVRLLDRMGMPTQYLCDYWSGWVRLPRLAYGVPLDVDDPVQTALAYREQMIRFYFQHKMFCH